MSDDEPDLPRLAVFAAGEPYGNTTLVLNRFGAESLLALLKDALEKKASSGTFYQHPFEDRTDTTQVLLRLVPSEAMDELVSQFACHKDSSKLGPDCFIRKHCINANT